ncbi:hypothetical protein [Streptomyces sp. NPDC005046]
MARQKPGSQVRITMAAWYQEVVGDPTQQSDWLTAMPTTLKDLADQLLSLSQTRQSASPELLAELQDRLELAFPDPSSRTLALLAWFGAGSGRYSGFPLHEKVPSLLLRDIPIAAIIAALQDPRADARHDAGAVRHLVGWKSRRKQKRDIAALPEPLRLRLLQQARASSDKIPQHRSERWLAPTQPK